MKKFTAAWTGKETELNNSNLTTMETAVLIAARNNDYNDCLETSTWTFAVEETAEGVAVEQFRGVCSSLIKKGYINITLHKKDSYFALTEEGKKLFSDYDF